MVGSWVLVDETNISGYTFNGAPVEVHGLAGTTLTIAPSGDEKLDFGGSKPLVGTLADGRLLSISIGGSIDLNVHAQGGEFVESGSSANLPTTATVNGDPITDYHSSYGPGRGTYSCTSSSLVMTTDGVMQTMTWSRAKSA